MGKGDQRSRRGKIVIGSFGRLRPRNKVKATTTVTAEAKTVVAKAEKKKAAPKKAAK